MKKNLTALILLFVFGNTALNAQDKVNIPLPSPAQMHWLQKERMMFVHFDPSAWQGREYDNHSYPIEKMHLSALNTDQWCETARLWGAKTILFVAKHTGGFCWWQTQTSEYGIRNTPWKGGRGDVLKDLSESCKKYGLELGVYVYPGDETWGAGIGSGGKTKDPAKQEAYNKVFRQQIKETLTQYGPISEVWFDGSCIIPVDDLLREYAPDAVVFQGPSASLRWVGNEDGIGPDPNWYTLSSKDLATGVATALHSDVNGDAYAPVEVNVPLMKHGGHKWFWAPNTDHLLMTDEELMMRYYKSVGRGSILLLNSTPDTSGLIPASHVARYRAFGEEIVARFDRPLKRSSGSKEIIEISFRKPTEINHTVLQEKLSKGQRVVEYVIEGSADKGRTWKTLYSGTSVGHKKIDRFPTVSIDKVRARFVKTKAMPDIINFAVYDVKSKLKDMNEEAGEYPVVIGNWDRTTFDSIEWKDLTLDLTPHVSKIGQYEIKFQTLIESWRPNIGLDFKDWQLEMYGHEMNSAIKQIDGHTFRIDRSQQTLDEFKTVLRVRVKRKPLNSFGEIVIRRITY
ncbi:MAG: alpha-L-fucosidase [Tannerella sp.]|jgi:alpha-L-fucosidase|nr:alpha-L-fucosidase [Tannerella sp.]